MAGRRRPRGSGLEGRPSEAARQGAQGAAAYVGVLRERRSPAYQDVFGGSLSLSPRGSWKGPAPGVVNDRMEGAEVHRVFKRSHAVLALPNVSLSPAPGAHGVSHETELSAPVSPIRSQRPGHDLAVRRPAGEENGSRPRETPTLSNNDETGYPFRSRTPPVRVRRPRANDALLFLETLEWAKRAKRARQIGSGRSAGGQA